MKIIDKNGNVIYAEYYAKITVHPYKTYDIVITTSPKEYNVILRENNVTEFRINRLLEKYKVKSANRSVWY